MKALPPPEKPVVDPAEVWSPAMGTEPMPLPGEIAVRAEGLRCNYCGCLGCPYEPLYRNWRPMAGPDPERYDVNAMGGVSRYYVPGGTVVAQGGEPVLERYFVRYYSLAPTIPSLEEWLGQLAPTPSPCIHARKTYTPRRGWRCSDCDQKV